MDRHRTKQLKAAAKERLAAYDGVVGLGVRGDQLVVYVRDVATQVLIPAMICDTRVVTVVTGDITAAHTG